MEIGSRGGGPPTTLKVDTRALAKMAEELYTLASYFTAVCESAPHDFDLVVTGITPSDMVDALMTYSESWLPPLADMTNTMGKLCTALATAVKGYVEAEQEATARASGPPPPQARRSVPAVV